MVALAIMSLAIVALFQLFSASLRTVRKAEDHTRALFYARALFEEAYSTGEIDAGSDREEYEDRYTVTRQVSRIESAEEELVKLYEIVVTVTWPPRGQVRLSGLRAINETQQ